MSAAHMALVFAHSESHSVARLVALALANGYDTEADHAVASIDVLCRETAATPEQVQRGIAQLVKLGEWAWITRGDGVRVLRMTLGCPMDCDGTAAHRLLWEVLAS